MSNTLHATPFAAPLDIRFVGIIGGRYSFARGSGGDAGVYACRTQSLSPTQAAIAGPVAGNVGQDVNLLLDHIGFLKAQVARPIEGGLVLDLVATDADRRKLAAKINWLKKRSLRQAVDKRDTPRRPPRNPRAFLYIDDAEQECFLIDVSLSGAGISAATRPPIGTAAMLGGIPGHIVRHMELGFGFQFEAALSPSVLDTELNARHEPTPA